MQKVLAPGDRQLEHGSSPAEREAGMRRALLWAARCRSMKDTRGRERGSLAGMVARASAHSFTSVNGGSDKISRLADPPESDGGRQHIHRTSSWSFVFSKQRVHPPSCFGKRCDMPLASTAPPRERYRDELESVFTCCCRGCNVEFSRICTVWPICDCLRC